MLFRSRAGTDIQGDASVVRGEGDKTPDDAGARTSSGEDYQDYQGNHDARKKGPANKDRDWQEVLQESVKAYNDVHSHRAIEMTPEKARLPANTDEVKQNLEEKRVSTRKYPNIIVGDNVRLYHKKNQLDKERVALWSDTIYKVDEIVVSKRQKMYKISNGKDHKYMRHELLKIE